MKRSLLIKIIVLIIVALMIATLLYNVFYFKGFRARLADATSEDKQIVMNVLGIGTGNYSLKFGKSYLIGEHKYIHVGVMQDDSKTNYIIDINRGKIVY